MSSSLYINNPLPARDPGDDDLLSLLIIIVINHYHYQYQLSSPWPGGAYLRLAHAVRLHPHAHLEQPDHHGTEQVSGQDYK